MNQRAGSRYQRGLAFQVILGWLALAVIASMAFNGMVSKDARFKGIESNTSVLVGQVNQIRNALNICVAQFPTGNNGTGFHIRFPGGATATAVSTLTCPGNPATNKSIFQGQNGGFLDPVPSGFTSWSYVNDASGIRISITSNGGNELNIALGRVAAKYSGSVLTGNTLTYWIMQG